MPRSEGTSAANNAGSQSFVATLAGVDLDCRLCLAVAAAISLALIGGVQLELLVAALALLRTAWDRSQAGGPTPRESPAKCAEAPPTQEPGAAPAQHHRGGDGHLPRAGHAAAAGGDGGPKLPRVRGPSRHTVCQHYVELIMTHAHARKWRMALEVLAEMRQLSIPPNVAVFTALISACDKGRQPEKALELFGTMQKEGIEPTLVTYNALISACSNGQMPERALEKYAEMQERGQTPNVVTYTSLIRAFLQSDHPQRAWEVFKTMKEAGEKPNAITFSSLLKVAQSCGDPEKAIDIFAEMLEAGIEPPLAAYNDLKNCWRNQPLSRALKALRTMASKGTPLSRSACQAVRSVCDLRKLEKDVLLNTTLACSAFAEMRQKGFTSDVASYAIAIGACEESRMHEQGLQLFHEMLDEGVSPDIMLYNCALRCCERLGDAEKAREVFEKMNEQHVSPDVDTYVSLISTGGKGFTIVMDHFKGMQDRGPTPSCHTYNTAISACSRLKRRNGHTGVCIGLALDLFSSMKEAKVVPDASTYHALITACDMRAWPWRAEELFREMETSGPEPDVIAYNGLISCWAHSKKLEKAMQVLDEMQSKGVDPNATTYSTLVRACEKAGDGARMREFMEKEAKCSR